MLGIWFDRKATDGEKVEEWTPYGQKRAVGRPMTRWRDEIEKELGPQWRRVARERKKWRECGEAFALKEGGVKEE